MMMAMLLPIHAAATLDWLVDATGTAAERTLNSPFTFVYLEEQDGRLERRQPASDLRRRSQQRAIDAFGRVAFATKLDPRDAPVIAEALDSSKHKTASAAEIFRGLVVESDSDRGAEGARHRRGVVRAAGVGGRAHRRAAADARRRRRTSSTSTCSRSTSRAPTVNLRQAEAARESGVIDVARSVFDARKIEADLQRELARAERYKRDVSIAVVEATNLRLLRERFGEFLTDRLLQGVGEALAQNARDIDVIGAYKESGYTMILTEATSEGAESAARRLLAIAQEAARGDGSVPGLELHLTAGWATAPADGSGQRGDLRRGGASDVRRDAQSAVA